MRMRLGGSVIVLCLSLGVRAQPTSVIQIHSVAFEQQKDESFQPNQFRDWQKRFHALPAKNDDSNTCSRNFLQVEMIEGTKTESRLVCQTLDQPYRKALIQFVSDLERAQKK